METAIEQVNKERAKVASKPNKRACTKKSDAVVDAQDIGNEAAVTGESSRPKRKSTSTCGEREASKEKKPKEKLTLAAAILQVNNLTSKTKPFDVEAIYKSLDNGMGNASLMGKTPCPTKFLLRKSTSYLTLPKICTSQNSLARYHVQ